MNEELKFFEISKKNGGCYEMDKTSISMFEILEPGGQLWANTAFEGSLFYSIGVPKFYSWVNVISVYLYNDLGLPGVNRVPRYFLSSACSQLVYILLY